MSVITFEDFPPSQSKETLLPQKPSQNGNHTHNKEITIPNELPDQNTDSNTKVTLPLPKPTGNTPRFGSGNRAESLKPLKQRPAKLLTKFSDSMTEDQSPQVTGGAKEVGKSFEVYHTGTESPCMAILSPSHQRRVETGSAGNSPKRKPYSLKHPLISRKSPLFKKFGFSPGLIGQKNVNVLNVSISEHQSSDKHNPKGNSPDLGSEMINIQNRTNLNQMIEKRNEGKRNSAIEPNQFLHISLTNVDKTSDNPSLSSGTKEGNTPQSYIHARVSAELYSSEPQLFSEPSVDWTTHHAFNASKTKVNNVKENFPTIKVISESKSPQLYPLRGKGPVINNRLLSANSSLANTKPPKAYPEDETLHQRIVLGPNKGLATLEAKKKNIPYSHQKMRSGNKTAFVSIKDDSMNESFHSLELSAIVQETNDRDFLNMSKDDGILQYIDKDEIIEGDPRKMTYNPPYIPKQIGPADSNKQGEDSALKEMRKTNSTNHLEALEPASQNKKSIVHEFPFKFKKGSKVLAEAKPQRAQRAASHNPYLSGGKRAPMKSRTRGDDSLTQHSQGNYDTRSYYIPAGTHDRNSSMFEMTKQNEGGRMLFHPEDNEPLEELRQRRVESALTKPTESYFDQGGYRDSSKGPIQVPNSEKNNLKHFQFVLSPSNKPANTDSQDESKKIYKRVYLQGKPNTSGPMTRGYAKYKRLNVPSRADIQNGNFAFNSIGHTQVSLNDSTGNETLETSLADKNEARRIRQKPDSAYTFVRRENIGKLGPNPGDFNMQKLRDEIKKLQVKDQESQMKIAILNMQLDNKHKEWEKKYEVLETQWKYKLTQQRDYYEKGNSSNPSKKV